jgi:hypothetical protein
MRHYHLISEERGFHFITVPPDTYRLHIARLPDTGPVIILHVFAIIVAGGEAIQTGAVHSGMRLPGAPVRVRGAPRLPVRLIDSLPLDFYRKIISTTAL